MKTKKILPVLTLILVVLLGGSTARAAIVTNTFTANDTWTAPAGVLAITVEAWGGGGAGGGASTAGAEGAGGAGGQYAIKTNLAVTPGTSYAIVVAGTTAGTTGTGSAGGDTTFGDSTVVAQGGAGGTNNNSGAGIGSTTGGVGDIVYAGGDGSASPANSQAGAGGGGAGSAGAGANAMGTTAGGGTPENGGTGGAGRTTDGVGNAGSNYGGGGGGGVRTGGTSRAGGNGAAGFVRITYVAPEVVSFSAAGSSAWVVPPGVSNIYVETWGGGGRGGTGTSDGEFGGGGGGAYSLVNLAAVPGTTYTVVVGAGSASTTAGGDSYFYAATTTNVLAKGGASVANNVASGAAGGAAASGIGTLRYSGGTGANGSINNYGGGGGSSAGISTNGANGSTSFGGTAPTGGGNGGNGATADDNPGQPGVAPGGGGGGARRNNGTVLGGTGADGQVLISFATPDSTLIGTATASGSGATSLAVAMPFTGDHNANNTYTVEYKFSSGSTWSTWVSGAAHTVSPYATTITGLTPGGTYDVRVTYNDADGVSGTNPQTITSVTTAGNGITELQAWSNLYHGTSTSAQNIAYAVAAGSDTHRILVVALASARTTVGSRTVTLTYGGQTLTLVDGDMASTTPQQHTALYYLDEAGLDAATNTTLSVTVSGGTTRVTDVFAAVYDNVNQTTPIADAKTYSSGTSQVSTFALSSGLAVNAGNQAIEIISSDRTGNTTPRTVSSFAANWALATQQTWTTTDGVRNLVATRTVPVTNVTADTTSTTLSGTSLGSMTALSLGNIKASPAVIFSATAITYGQALSASSLAASESDVAGTFTFDAPATIPSAAGTYSAAVTFTPTETANYNPVTSNVNVTVSKATPTLSVANSPANYNGSPQAAVVNGSVAGTVSNVKYDGSATLPSAPGTYAITADFAPTDSANYNSVTDGSAGNFVINPTATTVGTATASGSGATSLAVAMPFTGDHNANNTYTVEYKFSSGSTWSTWVSGAAHTVSPYATTITGLTPGGTYDVRVTYNDADGVSGTNPQTITSVTTAGNGITELQAWSNLYHGTSTSAQNIAYAVAAGSDTHRILVVALASARTTVGSRTVTLTYGGQTLTLVDGDMASTTPQQHTALYYLDEAGLDAATNTTLSVTVSGGTTRVTDVFAAVYDNVNQTTPIADAKTYSSGTSQVSTFALSSGLAVNAGNQAIEIISSDRTGNTTPRTVSSFAANWALATQQTWTTTDGVRNLVATRTVPVTNVTADTTSTTLSGTSLGSMTALSLGNIKASPAVIFSATAITYGQALSASSLAASESDVAGTFTFDAPATIPSAAGTYSAAVTFTPTETANYNPVTSNVNVTVNVADSGISLISSENPSLPGASVTFTATATNASAATGIPTGTVQFQTNGVAYGSPVALNGSGEATLITSSLPHGSIPISAIYAGDGNFDGSASSSVAQVVNTPPVAANHTLAATMNTPVNISRVKIASTDTDADGDSLSITNVSATSTNGGTVSLGGNIITYSQVTYYTRADSFTYTHVDS